VKRHTHRRGWSIAGIGVAFAAAAALSVSSLATPANAEITGTLYAAPNSASNWVAANPNDSRAAVIRDKIVGKPVAIWLTRPDIGITQSTIASTISAAGGAVPQFVLYTIPNRDCGGASAGGFQDLGSWNNWVQGVASAIGNATVVLIVEPDSLALQTCLNASEATARGNAIANAVRTLKSTAPNAKVYLDAGHSSWNPANVAASRLQGAGVTSADGFYSNVSNFNVTANEIAFGQQVLAALGNPGNLHQVIDTSRNGNGVGSTWCDPAGRALGQAPSLSTGTASVDAFLWIKVPGEADGCAAGAGTFVPQLAYDMANAAH
jgi:endoglucanase